jgi:hypothetical protein
MKMTGSRHFGAAMVARQNTRPCSPANFSTSANTSGPKDAWKSDVFLLVALGRLDKIAGLFDIETPENECILGP